MKTSFALALLLALALPALAAPLDTAFTYQGELRDAGVLANGLYDLEVRLFDASTNGAEAAPLVTLNDVPVADGKFTVALNFGSGAFAGSARYLQLAVRAGASVGPYTIVLPRQLLRATPEALHANVSDIAPWAGLVGVPTGFSDGVDNDSGGTVKSVAAGTGLTGGTITNTGTLSIDGSVVQLRVTGTCAGGQSISAINSNGTVSCAGGAGGTGTVTQVTAGAGLSGGSITTSGTIAVATKGITTAMLGDNVVGSGQINANQVQRRISGSCSAGRYFRGVAADGNIMCEVLPGVHSISEVQGPVPKAGTYLSMALGTDGLPVIAQAQGSSGAFVLRVTHCNDLACSGGDEDNTTIDNTSSTGLYNSIAIGADGNPVISYLTDGNADLWVAKCSTPTCSGTVTRSLIEAGQLFDWTSIAIGVDGLPVIAYKGGFGNSTLRIAKCNDPACAGGDETITGQTIAGTNNGGYARLVIGADGFPLIAHKNYALDAVKVTHCVNAACSGAGSVTTTVDDTASVLGTSLNLVLRPGDSSPFVAHLDQSNGTVRIVACQNQACTASVLDAVITDSAGPIGGTYALSFLFGKDGLPVLAYHNLTTLGLRVAHCDDNICGGNKATYATLDDPGGTMQSIAMVIGPDNMPIVAYQIFDTLKVVKCGNRSCQ